MRIAQTACRMASNAGSHLRKPHWLSPEFLNGFGHPAYKYFTFPWVYSEFQLLHAVSRNGFASIILYVLHGFHDFSAQIWIKTRGWHISWTCPQTEKLFYSFQLFTFSLWSWRVLTVAYNIYICLDVVTVLSMYLYRWIRLSICTGDCSS